MALVIDGLAEVEPLERRWSKAFIYSPPHLRVAERHVAAAALALKLSDLFCKKSNRMKCLNFVFCKMLSELKE